MTATLTRNLLTPEQTAEILAVKPQTLAAWRCLGRGGLPYKKIGRCVRYDAADVEAWLERRTVTHTGQAEGRPGA